MHGKAGSLAACGHPTRNPRKQSPGHMTWSGLLRRLPSGPHAEPLPPTFIHSSKERKCLFMNTDAPSATKPMKPSRSAVRPRQPARFAAPQTEKNCFPPHRSSVPRAMPCPAPGTMAAAASDRARAVAGPVRAAAGPDIAGSEAAGPDAAGPDLAGRKPRRALPAPQAENM